MKPYSTKPGEAHATKYARKSKRIPTRDKIERTHRKRARIQAAKDCFGLTQSPAGRRERNHTSMQTTDKNSGTIRDKHPSSLRRVVRLSLPQHLMLASMEAGQWYGDYVADDVKHWPLHWNKRTFRKTLRKLRELGKIEFRMREYEHGHTAFNVRRA